MKTKRKLTKEAQDEVRAYFSRIGAKGGRAGTGAAKARKPNRAGSRKGARERWARWRRNALHLMA